LVWVLGMSLKIVLANNIDLVLLSICKILTYTPCAKLLGMLFFDYIIFPGTFDQFQKTLILITTIHFRLIL